MSDFGDKQSEESEAEYAAFDQLEVDPPDSPDVDEDVDLELDAHPAQRDSRALPRAADRQRAIDAEFERRMAERRDRLAQESDGAGPAADGLPEDHFDDLPYGD